MPLHFEPRSDGYRVCRKDGGTEIMLASVHTKRAEPTSPKKAEPMPSHLFKQRIDEIGLEAALAERDASTKGDYGVTQYIQLPLNECTIHSAVGAMHVADLEEIIAHIKTEAK